MKSGNIESRNIKNINEIVFDSGELATLDSYTKLLIHGDSDSDSTGKTVTVPETYDSYTKLMLHCNGSEGSTTFTDSATAKSVTANGNAKVIEVAGSVLLDGNSDYLSLADSADWNFGSGDFTIDMWVRFNSLPTTGNYAFLYWQGPDGDDCLYFAISNHGGVYYVEMAEVPSVGVSTFSFLKSYAFTTSTWYHMALVRNGNDLKIFVDGIQLGSTVNVTGLSVADHAGSLWIGQYYYGTQFIDGWLDEIRVSKGIARWTANFIPQTTTYASDSYDKLLIHADGVDGYTTFVDSATGKTVTTAGTAQIDKAQYKVVGNKFSQAGNFDGTGDYLSISDSADWGLGNTWTVDCWVKFNTLPPGGGSYMNILNQYVDGTHFWTLDIRENGSGLYVIYYRKYNPTPYGDASSAFSLSTGVWYHFAWVMNGSNTFFFKDGALITTSGSVDTIPDFAAPLHIGNGANVSAADFSGWMDEVRISKGVARWTASFIPPTTPYGNVAVTTSQYKFPLLSRSLEFDGSDYITLANSADFAFGSGNFTIDFWAKFNVNQLCHLIELHANPYGAFAIIYNNGSFSFISSEPTAGTVEFQVIFDWAYNTNWNHFAFVRSGNTIKCFVNGVLQVLTYEIQPTGSLTDQGSTLYIGYSEKESGRYYDGWLQEYRISKGIARWTSNFDVPTDIYGGPVSWLCATGLDGDTDEQYHIISRQIGGPVNQDYIRFSINEDNVANPGVYGIQRLYASNNTGGAVRGTASSYGLINYTYTAGATSLGEYTFYAKSGNARTWTGSFTGEFETTYNETEEQGTVWNNTVDNVVSFQGFGVVDNHIGAGSRLIIVRNAHAILQRTGTMDVVGKVKYAWQEIYNYEVGAAEDSYTKLLIHGDSNTKNPYGSLDSTGKTITVPEVNDSYTKLMLHFNGADTSTTFTDSSLTGRTITAYGTAQLDTEKHKFQTASGWFDGNSDYITAPDHADWNFGTGDFTIDCWIRINAMTDGVSQMIASQYVTTYPFWMYYIYQDGSNYKVGFQSKDASANITWNFNGNMSATPIGRWTHLALVRNGSVMKIYENGVEIASGAPVYGSGDLVDVADVLTIGRRSDGSYYFDGWIDELRISKGIARWTSAFTPKDIPYGAVGSTNQECKFSQIGRSFEFGNGGNTYATLADSADWDFGTGAFTIDCWVKFNSVGSSQAILDNGGYLNGVRLAYYASGAGTPSGKALITYIVGTAYTAIEWQPIVDTWYHIAASRSGNNLYQSVDGVMLPSPDDVTGKNITGLTQGFAIGTDLEFGPSACLDGYVSEARVSKGIARWTSTFTPPTSPYGGPVSNVSIPISGNTDVLYKIKVKTVAGGATHGIRLNNNSSSDYRGEYLLGINTATSAARSLDQVYIPLNYNNLVVGDVNYSEGLLYTNSGHSRTYLGKAEMKIVLDDTTYTDEANWTTTVGELQLQGNEWVNSIDEVKDIGVVSIANNALGPGSHIIIEKLNL